MKKIVSVILGIMLLVLGGCKQQKTPDNEIRVGTIAGPETTLMEVAQQVAYKCYGLKVKIITFSDYSIPNTALEDGSIDANMFQHLPFLEKEIKERGYHLDSVGETFVYPMGIYSQKLSHLSQLKPGSTVAIPNDPSNEMRALLLLQKAGLIRLDPHVSALGTVRDIRQNPKQLKFIALDAAQLPRSLSDVSIAVINTNYAIPAGLRTIHALFKEGPDSPYANVVAVRTDNAHLLKVRQLVASLHSPEVLAAARNLFGDAAIPAWNTRAPIFPRCNATLPNGEKN